MTGGTKIEFDTHAGIGRSNPLQATLEISFANSQQKVIIASEIEEGRFVFDNQSDYDTRHGDDRTTAKLREKSPPRVG